MWCASIFLAASMLSISVALASGRVATTASQIDAANAARTAQADEAQILAVHVEPDVEMLPPMRHVDLFNAKPEVEAEAEPELEPEPEVEPEPEPNIEPEPEPESESKPEVEPEPESYETPGMTYVSVNDLLWMGVVDCGGWRYTYYQEHVLPGGGLDIPGRHHDGGRVVDGDGYVCVASSDLPYGTVVDTPVGMGKVYDTGCDHGVIDIYLV